MPAVYNNLYVEQNATYNKTYFVDGVGELSGNASGQIRKSYYSSNTSATFDVTLDSANSTITLQLDAESTANISYGRYVYDVIINDSANNTITRVLEGIVDVSPSVTR
jgi:hypothetical protein